MLLTNDSSAVYTRTTHPIRSILVATDLSPSSRYLVRYATELARQYDATVHFLYVVCSLGYTLCGPDVVEQARQLALRDMDELKTKLVCGGALKGLRSQFSVVQGDIAERIEDYARAEDIDLVVIGTHRREGFPRLVLGSLQQRILRRIRHPVLSVNVEMSRPELYSNNFDHVLFATDLGAGSRLGLWYAASIADQFGATLSMLHVIAPFQPGQKQDRPAESPVRDSLQRLRALSDSAEDIEVLHHVETGDIAESIVRTARAACAKLIVLGSNTAARVGNAGRFFETARYRVICGARCPVLSI